MYKIQFSQTSYLPQDRRMFELSLVRLHQYPTPIEQQWIFLVQQAQLRKIATNITPISQGRQLFTNWLLSRRLSNRGQGRIANVVTENRNGTKQVVNDTPSTKSRTIILDNEDNNRSSVQIAGRSRQTKKIRIRLPQSPFNDTVNNSNIRPKLIPFSTISIVNYQCGRLLKKHHYGWVSRSGDYCFTVAYPFIIVSNNKFIKETGFGKKYLTTVWKKNSN